MTKTILSQGNVLHYRVFGEGKPVMLVHGFGETGEVWLGQAAVLSKTCKVIVPDLPGSGASPLIKDMSMEGMAEFLHDIIHEENIDRCTLIGHSMGGYIALAFLEKYYNHVDGWGLFHSSAKPDGDEKKAARRKSIEFIKTHGAFEFLKSTSPNLFSPKTRETNPELVEDFLQSLSAFSGEALIKYYEAMIARPDRQHILRNAPDPVLFVIGAFDQAIPPADMLEQSAIPEISYIHLLQDSAHMGMLEESKTSTDILQEFISRV